MPDNSTALKWLVRLDEIDPMPIEGWASPPSPSRLGLLIFILALLLVTLPIAIYGAFLKPVPIAEIPPTPNIAGMIEQSAEPINSAIEGVNARLDTLESGFNTQLETMNSQLETTNSWLDSALNAPSVLSWEYQILQYVQLSPLGADLTGDGETPMEFVTVDRSDYATQFAMNCGGNIFDATDAKCIQDHFKGLSYYIGVLGADGWELLDINDKSDSTSYSVELFFKRPLQAVPNV
jgi:hypothetical protein